MNTATVKLALAVIRSSADAIAADLEPSPAASTGSRTAAATPGPGGGELIPAVWWRPEGVVPAPRRYDGSQADALWLAGWGIRPDGTVGVSGDTDLEAARHKCDQLKAAKTAAEASDIIPRAGDLDSVVAQILVMTGCTQGGQDGAALTFGVGFADGLDLAGAIKIAGGSLVPGGPGASGQPVPVP